jgi:hypothetical protein
MGQIQKTSKYFLSKQGGTVMAKKPNHATVSLIPAGKKISNLTDVKMT